MDIKESKDRITFGIGRVTDQNYDQNEEEEEISTENSKMTGNKAKISHRNKEMAKK